MQADLARIPVIGEFIQELTFADGLRYAALGTLAALLVVVAIAATTSRAATFRGGHHWLSKLIYAAFLLTVVVLAGSSFSAILTEGHMLGYRLLAHIGAAGGFVFLLLAIAFLYLPRGSSGRLQTEHRWWLTRASAWLLVLASITTAATMFISMLPILGTDGLHEAAEIHRWAGLTVVVAAIFHLTALCCTRVGLR